jgi:hypothetical protein
VVPASHHQPPTKETSPMKKVFIAAFSLIGIATAFAAEAPVKSELVTTSNGLTIQDCLTVLTGLQNLDGHWVIINAGKPNEDAKLISYVFENATLRGVIRDDIAALTNVQTTQQHVEQDIYREIAGEKIKIEDGTKEVLLYNQKVFESKQRPCTAILTRFSIKDLKLDKNEIPGSILGAIDKIMDR